MSEWVSHAELPDIKGRHIKKFGDNRGWFMVPYSDSQAPSPYIQDNVSLSNAYVFRGMHFQHENPQAKLITVLQGAIIDFFMDLRQDSPTFGKWGFWPMGQMFEYPDKTWQLFIPEGFAHGFLSMRNDTIFSYKVDEEYHPEDEYTLHISQLEGIKDLLDNADYPSLKEMIISDKDKHGLTMKELEERELLF
jgi:dTDP-4-dehydrorhamnose 3,5-epimerase